MGFEFQEVFFAEPSKFGNWWEGSAEVSVTEGQFALPLGVDEGYVHSLGVVDPWPTHGRLVFTKNRETKIQADFAIFDLAQRGEQWRTLVDPNLIAALARLINEVTDQIRRGAVISQQLVDKMLPSAYLGWCGPGLVLPIPLQKGEVLRWRHEMGDLREDISSCAGKMRVGYLFKKFAVPKEES